MATYSIVRFRFKGETTVVKAGVTLEEAQAHCQREDTHGEGWFDGYREEKVWRDSQGETHPASRKMGLLESALDVFVHTRRRSCE